eukprot:351665-Chlamydomonas_euryale.AAC.5
MPHVELDQIAKGLLSQPADKYTRQLLAACTACMALLSRARCQHHDVAMTWRLEPQQTSCTPHRRQSRLTGLDVMKS